MMTADFPHSFDNFNGINGMGAKNLQDRPLFTARGESRIRAAQNRIMLIGAETC